MRFCALVLLSCTACIGDLDVVAGSKISCGSNAECPEGYECRTALGLCVKVGADATLPAIANVTIVPEVIGPGDTVTLSFEVTKALGRPPLVTLNTRGSSFSIEATADAGQRYSATFGPFEASSDGAWPALVDLVDETGNIAPGQSLGQLVFDFRPPELVAISFDNPVLSATRGSRARFVASEALDGSPTFTLSCGAATLTSATTAMSAFVYAAELAPPSMAVEAVCLCSVTMTDLAGNAAMVEFPDCATLDTIAPDAQLFALDGVQHLRAPHGAVDRDAGHFLVAFGQDTAPEGSSIDSDVFGADSQRIEVYADDAGDSLLGVADRAGGSFPAVELALRDAPSVFVAARDAAGNRSSVERVRHGVWVASLEGNRTSNPHTLSAVSRTTAARTPLVKTALDDPAVTPATPKVGASFVRHGGEGPGPRLGVAMATDTWRGRTIVFGGARENVALDDTWEWTGTRFVQPVIDGSPSPRYGAVMTFDEARGITVLFGGYTSAGPSDETWLYDGRSWRFAGFGPLPGSNAGLVYDTVIGAPLLTISSNVTSRMELWRWDGDAWQPITTASGPATRSGFSFVYDQKRGRAVLFGGVGGATCDGLQPSVNNLCGLWELDGEAWIKRCYGNTTGDVCSELNGRHSSGIGSYDVIGERIVYLLGDNGGGSVLLTASVWDGNAFVPYVPDNVTQRNAQWISGRRFASATTDIDGRVLIFGGSGPGADCETSSTGDCDALWRLDERISRLATDDAGLYGPTGVTGRTFADDGAGAVYAFGGQTVSPIDASDALWRFSKGGWQRLDNDPSEDFWPNGDMSQAIGFDAARNVLVVLQYNGAPQLWDWDVATGMWDQRCDNSPGDDACTVPIQAFGTSLAFADPSWSDAGVFIVGGLTAVAGNCGGGPDYGTYCETHHRWDGTTMERLADFPAAPRLSSAFVFDATNDRFVHFGGRIATGIGEATADTYVLDAGGWREIATEEQCRPPPRVSAAMVHSAALGSVALYGGNSGSNPSPFPRHDAWWLDGECWQPLDIEDPEGDGRPNAPVAEQGDFISVAGGGILHGDASRSRPRTWRLDLGEGHSASVYFSVALDAFEARLFAPFISFAVTTDGEGFTTGVWDRDAYRPLSGASVDRLTHLNQRTLDIRLQSTATGSGATFTLRRIEARLGYTLP